MSALEGKADMTGCRCLLSMSLLGVKRTWLIALHMSAFDPKRTSPVYLAPSRATVRIATMSCLRLGGDNEATRFPDGCGLSGRVAADGPRAAVGGAGGRFLERSLTRFGFPLGGDVQPGTERSGLR